MFSSVSDSRMFLTLCFSFKRATSSARDGIIVVWQTYIKWGILLVLTIYRGFTRFVYEGRKNDIDIEN